MSEFRADSQAAVYSREEVVVAADPETVWKVMASIEDWPQWNPDVREASVEGDVALAHERLADADEAETAKGSWKERLAALKDLRVNP